MRIPTELGWEIITEMTVRQAIAINKRYWRENTNIHVFH